MTFEEFATIKYGDTLYIDGITKIKALDAVTNPNSHFYGTVMWYDEEEYAHRTDYKHLEFKKNEFEAKLDELANASWKKIQKTPYTEYRNNYIDGFKMGYRAAGQNVEKKDEVMKTIFDGAKFGDVFKTRNGKKAIYVIHSDDRYGFVVDGFCETMPYVLEDNICKIARFDSPYTRTHYSSDMDVVEKWKGDIDEKYLDGLVHQYYDWAGSDCMEAFKDGYRRAMEEIYGKEAEEE